MKDYLVRIITEDGKIRALAGVTTNLVREGARRHGAHPTAAAALGRALTAGALMGALLKTRQRVALKFEGNGPLKKIIVEADADGAVRGYVAVPEVTLISPEGKLDVGRAIGRAGFLTVTKDLGMKEPYRSMVQLYTGEIAEDVALYLTESEQIPSAVGLGVFVEPDGEVASAGGFLVQALPGASDEAVDKVMAHIETLPPLSDLMRSGTTPEELLTLIFRDMPYLTLEKREASFLCSCSRDRVDRALTTLGNEELDSMIREDQGAAVTCEFCRQSYDYNEQELEELKQGTNTQ